MLIGRTSQLTGRFHEWDIPVTEVEMEHYWGGELLQNAFPHLTLEEREFIKSGITPQEWKEYFGHDEDFKL